MKILVLWADEVTPNLGVRALARGSRDLLGRVWPEADLAFADFSSRPKQLPWGTWKSLLRERATHRKGMQQYLSGFDLVWDTRSGDSFADIYGMDRHAVMSVLHECAVQAGASVMMAPQTIGPFRTRLGKVLGRRNLRRSSLVFARDPKSAEAASTLGRPVDATVTDMVFAIKHPPPTTQTDVLLNVSGLLSVPNPHVDHEVYRTAVRRIASQLLNDGRDVSLIPHVLTSSVPDSDIDACSELAAELDGQVRLYTPRDLDDARSTIAGAQLVVGARMHACLNAISTGVPAIPMAYSRKFDPLLRSVEWKHSVSLMDGGDVAGQVLERAQIPDLKVQAQAAQARGQAKIAEAEGLMRASLSPR